MYVVEFKYAEDPFKSFMANSLYKGLPYGDMPGQNKTITFNYKNYYECDSFNVKYVTCNPNNIRILEWCCNKNFFKLLV